ncbi:hypothetical protein DFH04_07920 [Clostridium novyi]|uniref:hypothetical protein n=1 Tax=Clostridium novyi TaxID=1542 RepID=UPI000EA33AE8|nr:hypothetical protein [Clostridium novyi]AYF54632.1 hypothetical protein DFH04_07920 [Clostridium novyi]
MNANYITLFNGLTLLIKPSHKLGKSLYCYHWFNNSWVPIKLDINTIADMRYVKLHEPTMSVYNDSVEEMFNAKLREGLSTIPNTYSQAKSGGSELLTNTQSGIKTMPVMSTGTKPSYGTVISPVFPKVDSNWFYTGFPGKLTVGGANGNLIQYIPIFFYATRDGNEKFTLPTVPGRIGYLDTNNSFQDTIVWDGPFKKGQLLFTLLLDKNDPSCKDSKVNDTSYWNLLTEFSNIDPGSGASKSISITSGITQSQGFTMGLSVGAKVGVEFGLEGIGKISTELSTQLSTSFSVGVSISQQISTTDTVEFKPQPKTQRISTYQFIEQYKIEAAQPLKTKINSLNDKNKSYVANFAQGKFEPNPFDYGSRYFAKAFVLEP